jgi:hypothetical protein
MTDIRNEPVAKQPQPEKKPYARPQLTVHGTVESQTMFIPNPTSQPIE